MSYVLGYRSVNPQGFALPLLPAALPPAWPLACLPAGVAVRRGDEVRVDAVVRTRNLGHFFPGGTVDAFDVWLELRARDDRGRIVFWSGAAMDGGRGPVSPDAHFYRSRMLDGHGNPIDKRNAFATRSVVYVRLIPPGSADEPATAPGGWAT